MPRAWKNGWTKKHGWPGGEDGALGADGGDGGDGDHEGQTWKTPTALCQSTVFVAIVLMLPVMSMHRARVSWNLFIVANEGNCGQASASASPSTARRGGHSGSSKLVALSNLGRGHR